HRDRVQQRAERHQRLQAGPRGRGGDLRPAVDPHLLRARREVDAVRAARRPERLADRAGGALRAGPDPLARPVDMDHEAGARRGPGVPGAPRRPRRVVQAGPGAVEGHRAGRRQVDGRAEVGRLQPDPRLPRRVGVRHCHQDPPQPRNGACHRDGPARQPRPGGRPEREGHLGPQV
ncbi:MAG: hypothetical protein AVDCRST_MAG32-2564, partial [uncultured Nocardioides sp.]